MNTRSVRLSVIQCFYVSGLSGRKDCSWKDVLLCEKAKKRTKRREEELGETPEEMKTPKEF